MALRGLVFEGPGEIRFADDLADPEITESTDAIVDVTLAGLCGSDLHPYEGREPCARGVIPGHEAVGVVASTGPAVTTVVPGDRVIVAFTVSCGSCDRCRAGVSSRCRLSRLFGWGEPTGASPPLHGAQAQRLRVPLADGTLVKVPDGIDDATALLLTDNFPTAWHAFDRTDWSRGPVAVIGLGAVGLCVVAAARARGATEIVGFDPVESRRRAGELLGAATASPDDAAADFSAVVEAAGPQSAQRLAAAVAAVGATVSIIAVQTADSFAINPIVAYNKNLTIRAGRAPVRSVIDRVLGGVADGSIAVPSQTVITHPERPLEDGPGLYRAFAARDDHLIKATFRP